MTHPRVIGHDGNDQPIYEPMPSLDEKPPKIGMARWIYDRLLDRLTDSLLRGQYDTADNIRHDLDENLSAFLDVPPPAHKLTLTLKGYDELITVLADAVDDPGLLYSRGNGKTTRQLVGQLLRENFEVKLA